MQFGGSIQAKFLALLQFKGMCLLLSGIPIGRMSLACSDICPNLTAAIPWEDGHEKITDSLGDYGGHLLVCIVFCRNIGD